MFFTINSPVLSKGNIHKIKNPQSYEWRFNLCNKIQRGACYSEIFLILVTLPSKRC